jgi:arylsulfatase
LSRPPNVLFILSDQHNAKCLGIAGHPDVQTPNLDRLAGEGVRFTNCITQNPICTPSRVSFLSGQYVHNHGYYGLSGPTPRLPSLPGPFREAGYRTAAIGKIHCPDNWIEPVSDRFLEAYYGQRSDYAKYLTEVGLLADRDDEVLQEWRDMGGGGQGLDARVSRLPFEHCVEAWAARASIRFIDECGEGPFFLHCSLPRPHECYTPSEPFWSMYDESAIRLPPNADYDMSAKPPHFAQVRRWQEAPGARMWIFEPKTYEAGRRRVLCGYLGCVSQVDAAVGMLLDHLDQRGLAENTIVIYSSDHGDFAGEHGIIEKAPGICADAITRIPSLWRWPGRFAEGHTCDQLVESVDLAPTVLALAGLPEMPTADGRDLSGLLAGACDPIREVAVTENPWSKSLRTQRWRYVHYPEGLFPGKDVGELYDLESDPWEMENLYDRPEHGGRVCGMRRLLLDWLITTTRPTTFHPPLRPGPEAASHNLAEDGKALPADIRALIERGQDKYL